jgi:hypothetical protein
MYSILHVFAGSTTTSYWWVLQRVEHVSVYESFEKGYDEGATH